MVMVEQVFSGRFPSMGPSGTQRQMLADGRRLHLHHGPIDLILEAEGPAEAVAEAYARASRQFDGLLHELVGELEILRQPISDQSVSPEGSIAKRMVAAVSGMNCFVTPMAAVAGSVADHMLAVMNQTKALSKAVVNNGGDIAVHLTENARYRIGVAGLTSDIPNTAVIEITTQCGVGGIATSGWAGRSHSLGIADAVTVLANSAAEADAMATLIANKVDAPDSKKVIRVPAEELSPDSDLAHRLVTTHVGSLDDPERKSALELGCEEAMHFVSQERAISVYLQLQGEWRVVGRDFAKLKPRK